VNHPQIAAFARLAKEDTLPTRALEGQKTLISRTMHALAYDSVHDEIIVNSPLAQAILIFRGGANGEEAPIRVIQGPHTQIQGTDYDGNDQMAFDEIHGEIYIPVDRNKILTFSREANGDVAPLRVLAGPDTQMRGSTRGHVRVGVDPVHNLLIVTSNGMGDPDGAASLLMFDRTANGNVKPRSVIKGPKTQVGGGSAAHVSGEKGMIIAGCGAGSVCAWSINDSGDTPPRWKIPVQQVAGVAPSGIALDPAHKEVIITSGNRNRVLTFSWPEVF
jgi:hypothetical protein